jgi:L-lactate utilization protein LutC
MDMPTLDEIIKGANDLLAQASKRQVFGKVDNSTVRLPDEQRDRRIAELNTRIADLTQRKADVAASYSRAIALEQFELEALKAQMPPTNTQVPAKPETNIEPKTKMKKPSK